jgi:hypothetical protein
MTTRIAETPPFVVTRARLVGFLMLLPVPLGVFGSQSSRLVVPGDAAATADRILASESLVRLQTLSTLLLLIADACLLALVFYPLLKPVQKNLAVLMVTLNLLGVAVAVFNELNHFAILHLLHGAGSPQAFTPDQTHASLSLLLNAHDMGSLTAGLFWGLWLVPYAVLVFKSGFLPRLFAIFLIIECAGFLIQSIAGMLAPSPNANLALLPALTSLVELFLPLWMIVKGINVEQWAKHAGATVVAPVSVSA